MMRIMFVALASFALLATAPLAAQSSVDLAVQQAGATLLWGDPAPWNGRGDIQRVALTNGTFAERLTGEAALAHLYNLRARRPQAFGARQLQERGYKPTVTVYVERTIRLASDTSGRGGTMLAPAQNYSEQNRDGEIVFWSWSDGNNATWEGEIYVEVYSTGWAATYEGQIDASTSQHPWIWYENTWERPRGPIQTEYRTPPPASGFAVLAAAPSWLPRDPTSHLSGYALALRGMAWAKCWRGCVVGACTAIAGACLFSNGMWPKCFGGGCTFAELGCAIDCALS